MPSKKNALRPMVGLIIYALLGALCPQPARAQDLSRDPDYQELLKFFEPYVYTMTQPSYVYNWHMAKDDSELTTNTKDPRNYKYIQDAASLYWKIQSTNTGSQGNMFGEGLYGAIDPTSTRSFGENDQNGNDNWVLGEIHLPAGFRMLDLNRDGSMVLPMDKGDLITRLGCPPAWKNNGLLQQMLNPDTYQNFPKCAAVVRKLFRDDLKLDGFAYPYSARTPPGCDTSTANSGTGEQNAAFVITNGDKLSPNDVKLFDARTKDDPDARLRIQAIFTMNALKQKTDGAAGAGGPDYTLQALKAFLKAQGKPELIPFIDGGGSWSSSSDGTLITLSGNFCLSDASSVGQPPSGLNPGDLQVANSCVKINTNFDTAKIPGFAPPPPPPAGAPSPQTPVIQAKDLPKDQFLWSDLEGKEVPADLSAWMRKSLYGCEDKVRYQQANPAKKAARNAKGAAATDAGDGDANSGSAQ